MKKHISLLLTVLLFALALVGCGEKEAPLTGTYQATVLGTGTSLTFTGDQIRVCYSVNGVEVATQEGTFLLNEEEDRISIDLNQEEYVILDLPEDAVSFNGIFSFARGKDYIRIGTVLYSFAGDFQTATDSEINSSGA